MSSILQKVIHFPGNPQESNPELTQSVQHRLVLKANERKIKQKKMNIIHSQYEVRQKVLIKKSLKKKLILLYERLHIVTSCRFPSIYEILHINEQKTDGIYNTNQLKLYIE